MRYHVTLNCNMNANGAFIANGDSKAMLTMLEQNVLPTLDMLSKWEREKRVFGGCVAGAREISFVVEASSNEEVGELVHSLPIWGFVNTEIRPLESFEFRFNQDRKLLTEAKKRY